MKEGIGKASVIIPVYNTENYIGRAVQSVLKQTFQDFEILLVDDGSIDGSWDVCMKLEESDDRIHAFHQKNSGASAARNLGLKRAKYKYIFFLDSDDEWYPGLLKRVVEAFERTNCDCVRFQFESTKEELITINCPEEKEQIFSQKDFLVQAMVDMDFYKNISSACLGAYRRALIETEELHFSKNLALGEDGTFVMDYLLTCKEILYLNDKLYRYYVYFDIGEHMSTTSRELKVLYDEYELCFLLANKVYQRYRSELDERECQMVYSAFYDRMIGRLVRYAAYSKHIKWKKKRKRLKDLLESPLMKEASHYYKPFRKKDSRVIPYFMKNVWIVPFWLLLCMKRRRYYNLYGKKKYAISIYQKNAIIECWK